MPTHCWANTASVSTPPSYPPVPRRCWLTARQLEYAAAFFLLADSLHDAVSVILNSLHDPQLAITIARVYEGGDDSGPVLQAFLETKILPHAIAEGNRWLASWTFWKLRRKDMAVRALLSPLDSLLLSSSPDDRVGGVGVGFKAGVKAGVKADAGAGRTIDPSSRLFLLNGDPGLLIFYRHIRERTTTTFRGAQHITPVMEWDFVIATARVYDRMGCDLLALDLVKNWEFLPAEMPKAMPVGMALRRARRNSLMVLDVPSTSHLELEGHKNERKDKKEDEKSGGLVKPPAAVWEEPDMSWAF